ncbi:MAG: cupin domain-containing protein [Alphaproteobacteria bacterium]|nr:cupin domain-containing protein [Alphaproteobacteria bacterium]TAD88953.1 MAG: cupin domain-containing protein [Alphaproteobacteria bacterium]
MSVEALDRPLVTVKRANDLVGYRISPTDTNYMIPLFDPVGDGAAVNFTAIVEVFQVGGRTPPNSHAIAHEMFFVMRGRGIAHAAGRSIPLSAGDAILLDPGGEHVIENTGTGKLYTLTVMVPNEEFAELIHAGQRVLLDDEDRALLADLPMTR